MTREAQCGNTSRSLLDKYCTNLTILFFVLFYFCWGFNFFQPSDVRDVDSLHWCYWVEGLWSYTRRLHIDIFVTRFSCGSATPVSSDSSDSSPAHDAPPREPPPALPLDLLTEMEFLFSNNSQRRDSYPNSTHNTISLPDKSVSDNRP